MQYSTVQCSTVQYSTVQYSAFSFSNSPVGKNFSFKNILDLILPHRPSTRVIRSSMFLKEKFSPTGEFEKLEACLVAGGHMQNRDL